LTAKNIFNHQTVECKKQHHQLDMVPMGHFRCLFTYNQCDTKYCVNECTWH